MIGRLKAAMAARRFSIKKLATQTGIPYRTLQNYLLQMHGLPAGALGRICKTMSVSADWVLTGDLYLPVEELKEALDRTKVAPRGSPDNSTAAVLIAGTLTILNDVAMHPRDWRSVEAVERQLSTTMPAPRMREGKARDKGKRRKPAPKRHSPAVKNRRS